MIVPPPTPKSPLKAPARVPIAASFQIAWSGGAWRLASRDTTAVPHDSETGGGDWAARLEPLRREPGRAAILTDVDGTLAPIVERAPTRRCRRRRARCWRR